MEVIKFKLFFIFHLTLYILETKEKFEDLLEKIPIENDWYLVPSYFLTKVESASCKHKNFTIFTFLKNGLVE